MNLDFRKLNADEIEARVATVSAKGCSVLLYKNARCDMNILDECVGPMNWQRDHKELKGNMYSGIAIYDDEKQQWIWKWDCGTESYTEAEKGEASDSFKRAGFNWGIGRELYTSPFIWFKKEELSNHEPKAPNKYTTTDTFKVEEIEYSGKKISYLKIVNNKSKSVYTFGKSKGLNKDNASDLIDEEQYDTLVDLIQKANVNTDKLLNQYKLESLMMLTRVQYEPLKRKLEKAVSGE